MLTDLGGPGEIGFELADHPIPQLFGQLVSHALEQHQTCPGMARATARPPEGRISLSANPWITTVGAVIRRS
ncbi:hypothetical protein I553_0857 [Mycobacterium xenopi 4042]|uniref:Uncharacterized protein n=1 Tax=Mycobacterium xenopi 4042 TaxID=1299334 RepID=X7YJ72_MYCXE|nr:hypothetical protein I553_0857 [Mycobacterium xenopi 4042]